MKRDGLIKDLGTDAERKLLKRKFCAQSMDLECSDGGEEAHCALLSACGRVE